MFPRKDIRPGVDLPHLSADLVKLSPEYWINVLSNMKKSKEGWLKNSEILVSNIILTDYSHTKCNLQAEEWQKYSVMAVLKGGKEETYAPLWSCQLSEPHVCGLRQ